MIWMPFTSEAGKGISQLEGRRVLVVEDDFLVGLSIKSILEEIGCQVLGPVASVKRAMRMVEQDPPDAAVLDINIVGGTSVPIAETLLRMARPFVFVTGYQSPRHLLPEMMQEVTRLSKPVDEHLLYRALRDVIT